MEIFNAGYLIIFAASFVVAIASKRKGEGLTLIKILLLVGLLTECISFSLVYIFEYKAPQIFFLYHIYIPIDYLILSRYFCVNSSMTPRVIRPVWFVSVVAFTVISFTLSFYYGFEKFPGISLNLEGLLIIIWSVVALFNIKPQENAGIFSIPLFWISVGVMLYSSGNFFFNFIYQQVIDNQSQIANQLNAYVMKVLNYVLYICFILAFLWRQDQKKYS